MSRRRRAVLLGGVALVLAALAAADVSRRERALEARLGPPVAVVVAAEPLRPGQRLVPERLAVRAVPARYAPAGAFSAPEELVGLRAGVAIPVGSDVLPALVEDGSAAPAGPPVRRGERVADVVATGSPQLVVAGSRVDVVITRGGDGVPGRTELALEDVEVVAAAPAPGAGQAGDGSPRVRASLRVTLRQAVFLAAAQSFARDIRLLPRAAGDRGRGAAGVSVDSGLGT